MTSACLPTTARLRNQPSASLSAALAVSLFGPDAVFAQPEDDAGVEDYRRGEGGEDGGEAQGPWAASA